MIDKMVEIEVKELTIQLESLTPGTNEALILVPQAKQLLQTLDAALDKLYASGKDPKDIEKEAQHIGKLHEGLQAASKRHTGQSETIVEQPDHVKRAVENSAILVEVRRQLREIVSLIQNENFTDAGLRLQNLATFAAGDEGALQIINQTLDQNRLAQQRAFATRLNEIDGFIGKSLIADAERAMQEAQELMPPGEEFRNALAQKEERIRHKRNEILFAEYLTAADEALAHELYDEADTALAKAKELNLVDVSHKARLREKGQLIQAARQRKLDELARHIQEELEAVVDEIREGDRPEKPDDQIQKWIDEYVLLAGAEDDRAENWQGQFEAARKEFEIWRQVEDTRIKCLDLWEEGGTKNAFEARELAEGLRSRLGKHPRINKLIDEAEEKLADVRQVEGEVLTSVQAGLYKEAIEDYEKLRDDGAKVLPRFQPVKNKDGNLVFRTTDSGEEAIELEPNAGMADAGQVINELRDLARHYARQKAEEKENLARDRLIRDPEGAKDLVEEALGLYLIPDASKNKLGNWRENVVEPALQRRREAQKLCDDAEKEADVLDGWQMLAKALERDVHLPAAVETRNRLRPRFLRRARRELAELRRTIDVIPRSHLQEEENKKIFRKAAHRAAELADMAKEDENPDEEIKTLVKDLNAFSEELLADLEEQTFVHGQVVYLRSLLNNKNYSQANAAFKDVVGKLGEDGLKGYPELLQIQGQLQARSDVDGLVTRIEGDLSAENENLEGYDKDLQEVLKVHPDHQRARDLQRDIRSQLNYRNGRTLFQQKSYEEARNNLEAVHKQSPDYDEAQKLLEKLDEAEGLQEKLENDLSTAENYRAANQWERAYETLHQWTEKTIPSKKADLFWEAYDALKTDWEQQAISQLKKLVKNRPLDNEQIKEQLDALETLRSSELMTWRKKALAPLYAQQANIFRRQGKLVEAVKAWREAVEYDSEKFGDDLLAAEKMLVKHQVDAEPGNFAAARRRYTALLSRYETDLELRLLLANICIKDKDFDEAGRQLKRVRGALDYDPSLSDPQTIEELTRLEKRLEVDKAISEEQDRIAELLQAGSEREQYEQALSKQETLLQKFPQEKERLEQWWEERLNQLAIEVRSITDQRREEGEPLWRVAGPLLGILILRDNYGPALRIVEEMTAETFTLNTRVDACIKDKEGVFTSWIPDERNNILKELEDKDKLDIQIQETDLLHEEVAAYLFAIERNMGRVPDGKHKRDGLRGLDESLVERISVMRDLAADIQNGYFQLDTAKPVPFQRVGMIDTNEWIAVWATEDRLKQHDFSKHRTVAVFLREIQVVTKTRIALEEHVRDLKSAVESEELQQSLDLIDTICRLDPHDDYEIYGNLEIKATLQHSAPIAFRHLRQVIDEHLKDINIYFDWLLPVLRVAPWWPPVLPNERPRSGDLAKLNELLADWTREQGPDLNDPEAQTKAWAKAEEYVRPKIRELKHLGNFDAAIELCKAVLGDDGSRQVELDPFRGRLTLKHVLSDLQEKSKLNNQNAHSETTRAAKHNAEAAEQRIHQWLAEARQMQNTLDQDQKRFFQLRKQLQAKINQLGWVRLPLPFVKNRIREQGRTIYNEAKQIAPNNRYLETLNKQLEGL